ncbi:hypothetical protein CN417_28020 [Bacillus thuringiensis]|uniref:hypothetical protein n=1 Tax=Bacillus cereus group TaxID=86661 RepID=UPI000BF2B66F|nr:MULTISPECIES: hypothetical protein [Bacillus cereus group]PEV02468.1 hypothetical protein CN417_28020 [Bacillus thuringiensis]PEY13467.1 hypothetical protein CN331_27340 [Bacillus cereus]PFC28758.1 hypothetical protein CN299_19055 [Bacillus thuringiensis]PHF60742.1 hypothetical protein COI40_09740 [Bacillus wiedmannii]PHF91522.1 hypothetical protein COI45_22595 [Bacillus wiedmannii]
MSFISRLADIGIIIIAVTIIFNICILLIKNKGRKEFDSTLSLKYFLGLWLSVLENEKTIYEQLKVRPLTTLKLHYLTIQLIDFSQLKTDVKKTKEKISKTSYTKNQLELANLICNELEATLIHQELLCEEIKKITSEQDADDLLLRNAERQAIVNVWIYRVKVNIIRQDFEKDFANLRFKEADVLNALFKVGAGK